MKRFAVLLPAVLSLLFACSRNPVLPDESQLIVQAYLYAGEPVADIRIGLSRPITSTDSVDAPVANATVTLIRNGGRYALTADSRVPGRYFYPGADLLVKAGDLFEIEVVFNGSTATAQTVVPGKPTGVAVNMQTMTFTRDTMTMQNGDIRINVTSTDSMKILWNNPSQEMYFVVIESVDTGRQKLRIDSLFGFGPRGRFTAQPTMENFFRMLPQNIVYTGRNKAIVYKINPEYVDLYKSRQQDSRNLNEPLTNVKNGMGIFTAFAGDSVFFDVVLK
jgi:hypothetical protein